MDILYILDAGGHPIPCDNVKVWGEFYNDIDNRRIGLDHINGYMISTVFLGLDCGYGGVPILFETLVEDENGNQEIVGRYATWDQAEKGHQDCIDLCQRGEIKIEDRW